MLLIVKSDHLHHIVRSFIPRLSSMHELLLCVMSFDMSDYIYGSSKVMRNDYSHAEETQESLGTRFYCTSFTSYVA